MDLTATEFSVLFFVYQTSFQCVDAVGSVQKNSHHKCQTVLLMETFSGEPGLTHGVNFRKQNKNHSSAVCTIHYFLILDKRRNNTRIRKNGIHKILFLTKVP